MGFDICKYQQSYLSICPVSFQNASTPHLYVNRAFVIVRAILSAAASSSAHWAPYYKISVTRHAHSAPTPHTLYSVHSLLTHAPTFHFFFYITQPPYKHVLYSVFPKITTPLKKF
jgi:hypothetical protein